jgi:hypothetical protein
MALDKDMDIPPCAPSVLPALCLSRGMCVFPAHCMIGLIFEAEQETSTCESEARHAWRRKDKNKGGGGKEVGKQAPGKPP